MMLSQVRLGALSSNKLLLICGTGWLFDAMDVGILSFVLAALKLEWGLSAAQLGLINSVNSIGMAVGAFVFGLYADRKGRKSAFMITLLIFSIASGLSAFAWGFGSLLVLRFFIGMKLGGELTVASALVSESVPPEVRGRIVVLLESFWDVGWHGAMILCPLPAFYALYLRFRLPDSPHYLQLSQKEKKSAFHHKIAALWAPEQRRASVMLWIVWFCVVFSYLRHVPVVAESDDAQKV